MRDLRVRFPKPCDEPWEAMAPAGCNRVCARCDKVIHNLSQYAFDEAEALLNRNADTCVRARVDANGVVALKPGRRGNMRRMVIAAGASAGLLAAGGPAFAGRDRPEGVIAGKVEAYFSRTRVTATGPDGKSFRARVKGGRYKIKHVPAGTYRLTFVPDCGDSWTVENVVVDGGEAVVADTKDSNECIFIGMLLIEEGKG